MTGHNNDTSRILSRRGILWGGALVAAATTAAVWPAPALASGGTSKPPKKMGQPAVSYQPRPKSGAYCMRCSLFQTPDQCGVVEGPVSPNGWCSLFTPK